MRFRLGLILLVWDASLVLAVNKLANGGTQFGSAQRMSKSKVRPRILTENEYSRHEPKDNYLTQQSNRYPTRRSTHQRYYGDTQQDNMQFGKPFENSQNPKKIVDDTKMERETNDFQDAYTKEYEQESPKRRRTYRDNVQDNSRHPVASQHKHLSQHSGHPSQIQRIESRLTKIEEQEKHVEETLSKDFGPTGYLYKAIQSLQINQGSKNAAGLLLADNTISMTSARGESHIKVGVWKKHGCTGALEGVLELFTDLKPHACQSWKHFTTPDKSSWRDHSANYVTCDSHSISYRHYPEKECDEHGTRQIIADTCEQKSDLFMKIIDFSGCQSDDDNYEDDDYEENRNSDNVYRRQSGWQ